MKSKKELNISHHGRTVHGWFYEPDEERYPLVILSHGYNGYEEDFAVTAAYFAENGVGAVCYTFCGGSTRDRSAFLTTDMTLFTEEEDLCAVLDEVQSWRAVKKDQIFLFGASQGGMVSVMAAADRKDKVRGLILLYPALCIAEDWNTRFAQESDIPESEELWGMKLGAVFFRSLRGFQVDNYIRQYDGAVLILQGDQDAVVSFADSRRAAALYSDAKLEVFAGEGHGFSEWGDRRMEAMMLYFIHDCMNTERSV